MAKKGEKKHLKRIALPKKLPIHDKKERGRRFLVKPSPGPHKKESALPLIAVLRELLGFVETKKEGKFVLNKGLVRVDGKERRKIDFPIGLMDILEIGEELYLVGLDEKGSLKLYKWNKKDEKCLKVVKKKTVKKGILQLTFHDGRTYLTKDNSIKVGDGVIFDLQKKEIKKVIPLKEGQLCLITEGKHSGKVGELKGIKREGERVDAYLKLSNGEEVITRKAYLFPIDESCYYVEKAKQKEEKA